MPAPDPVKAIAVAQHLLDNLEKYKFAPGRYINILNAVVHNTEGDVQDNLPILQEHCEFCMLGGLLLAMAGLYDELPVDRINYGAFRQTVVEPLNTIFDRRTLDLAEIAFELHPGTTLQQPIAHRQGAAAFGFRASPDKPLERVRAVLVSIIENNGQFFPGPIDGVEWEGIEYYLLVAKQAEENRRSDMRLAASQRRPHGTDLEDQ